MPHGRVGSGAAWLCPGVQSGASHRSSGQPCRPVLHPGDRYVDFLSWGWDGIPLTGSHSFGSHTFGACFRVPPRLPPTQATPSPMLTMAPTAAATEPPPGVAERAPTSRTKSRKVKSSKLCAGSLGTKYLWGRGSATGTGLGPQERLTVAPRLQTSENREGMEERGKKGAWDLGRGQRWRATYSMTRSLGLKGAKESRPSLLTTCQVGTWPQPHPHMPDPPRLLSSAFWGTRQAAAAHTPPEQC